MLIHILKSKLHGAWVPPRSQLVPLLLTLYGFVSLPSLARADGGVLRLLERKGNYQIAVFTLPTPLRAGTADISVLIQEAGTLKPISGAVVTIKATQHDQQGAAIVHPATIDAATNKLFYAAAFDLPAAGLWELEVSVDGLLGKTRARVDLEVAEPLPPYLAMWAWVFWPAVPILLFGAHQLFVNRRPQRAAIAWQMFHVAR